MLTEFNFHAPSFVVAGRNSVHQTGELLNQWGAGKNIMVVCGNKTYSLGLLNSLLDSIRSGGFTPCVFHGSLPDAPVETVRSGITYAKEHDVSAIVAFGGGSAMDTAKAIACMLDVEGDQAVFGKPIGSDVQEGKVTFVDVIGMDACRQEVAACTETAKAAVAGWPDHGFLWELADRMVGRRK